MYQNGIITYVENTRAKYMYKYTLNMLFGVISSVIFFIAGAKALPVTRITVSILTRLQLHGLYISFFAIITYLQTF